MKSTQITVRNMARSPALSSRVRQLAEHLEEMHPQVLGCAVTLERASGRATQGDIYEATVRVRLRGREVVVSRRHDSDIYVAVRDAFGAARTQVAAEAESTQGRQAAHRAARVPS